MCCLLSTIITGTRVRAPVTLPKGAIIAIELSTGRFSYHPVGVTSLLLLVSNGGRGACAVVMLGSHTSV